MVDMSLTRSFYHEGGSFSMGNQSISAIIQQVVNDTSPIPPNTVTAGARRAVERRLYDLPRLCEQLEQGDTREAAEITREIDSIRQALQTISRDPYYPLIPAHYFHGLKERAAAEFCNCVKTTVFRNRTRLLDTLALRLFGVSAWDRTRNW